MRHDYCFRVRHLLQPLCSLSNRWQAPPSSLVGADLEDFKLFLGTHEYRPILEKHQYHQQLQRRRATVPSLWAKIVAIPEERYGHAPWGSGLYCEIGYYLFKLI